MTIDAYLSLGSNIAPRFETLQTAISSLCSLPGSDVESVSTIYETEAPVKGVLGSVEVEIEKER
ncbi:MAG TPA: hypothetical protein EYO34_02825, partial [Candidatus Marinimicrobia bacterium]|nr:hypothetical protein [Candidatus Neomarinimicrobiota bacterium]